jgi:carboxyl-terminal processing protease
MRSVKGEGIDHAHTTLTWMTSGSPPEDAGASVAPDESPASNDKAFSATSPDDGAARPERDAKPDGDVKQPGAAKREDRDGKARRAGKRSGGIGGPWPARIAALALVVLVLFAGVWLGGHPSELPGFMRGTFEANHQTEVMSEAIDSIAQDYYRNVSKKQLAGASIAGAVASLQDPFSHYLAPSEYHEFANPGTFSGVGLEATGRPQGLEIERVFNPSPAQRAGLRAGELIVAVNGRSLAHLPEESGRNLIRGKAGTNVTLTLQNGSKRRQVTVTRALVDQPVVLSETRTVNGKKVGVVYLAKFTEGAHGEVREAIERELHAGARGIVLDLRHNGGGLVSEARLVASIFVPKGVIVTMRSRTQSPVTLTAAGGAVPQSIPMVVLVDRDTASAAEIVTGALQDHHRAAVVGTHTFGKGVFQELVPLANGGALDITVGHYYTPNGHNLGAGGVKEGAGIAPEVVVPPQQIDTEAGLQAALRTLAPKLG